MKLTTMSQASVNAERLWANLYLSQALIKYSETQKKIDAFEGKIPPPYQAVNVGSAGPCLYIKNWAKISASPKTTDG